MINYKWNYVRQTAPSWNYCLSKIIIIIECVCAMKFSFGSMTWRLDHGKVSFRSNVLRHEFPSQQNTVFYIILSHECDMYQRINNIHRTCSCIVLSNFIQTKYVNKFGRSKYIQLVIWVVGNLYLKHAKT